MFCLPKLLMTRVWVTTFSAWFPILHTLTTVITRGTSTFNRGATTFNRGATTLTRGASTRTRNTSGKMDLITVLFSQTYENSAVAAQSFSELPRMFLAFSSSFLRVQILFLIGTNQRRQYAPKCLHDSLFFILNKDDIN
jgi:hypothetical protein